MEEAKLDRLAIEQYREEEEKRRSGMPGAIRRTSVWTRRRRDTIDYGIAKLRFVSNS